MISGGYLTERTCHIFSYSINLFDMSSQHNSTHGWQNAKQIRESATLHLRSTRLKQVYNWQLSRTQRDAAFDMAHQAHNMEHAIRTLPNHPSPDPTIQQPARDDMNSKAHHMHRRTAIVSTAYHVPGNSTPYTRYSHS